MIDGKKERKTKIKADEWREERERERERERDRQTYRQTDRQRGMRVNQEEDWKS